MYKSVRINIDDSSDSSDSVPYISRTRKKKGQTTIGKFSKSTPDQHVAVKALICFPIGCVVGVLFYYCVINPIDLEKDTKLALGTLLGFTIAVGYGVSHQIRCIVGLVIPIFFGKDGRSYVAAFALVYLIGGPISNLIVNSSEMVRSLSCITQLLANHTAVRFELRYKPMEGSLKELQEKGFVTKGIEKKFSKAFIPLEKELEDQNEIKKLKTDNAKADSDTGSKVKRNDLIEKKYKNDPGKTDDVKVERKWERKLDYRCEDVFSQGVLRCRRWFADSYRKCMDTLSIAGYLLCWPMKLDFFCELVRLIPGIIGLNCDAMEVVNPGVGEAYLASRNMAAGLRSRMKVNLQYKMVEAPIFDLNYMTAEEVRRKTIHAFERKKQMISIALLVIQRCLAFTFVFVFLSAFKYHGKYLSDFRYDNNYITSYFVRIDARRKKLVKGTVSIIFRAFVSGIVIMLDHLLYSVLHIIGKNSQIDYKQTGSHHIDLKVYGEGFMGDIVRLFLSSFNQKHDISQISSNAVCLPFPSRVDKTKITLIFSIYGGLWLLLFLQSYGLRLRRTIAGFYYRKREKRRILYLYNEMLRKRKGFLKMMRHRVKKQVKAQELERKTSVLLALRREYPALCCWLKFISVGKDTCLICEEREKSGYHRCYTPNCRFGYCADCWQDIDETCYACLDQDDSSASSSTDSSDSSDI